MTALDLKPEMNILSAPVADLSTLSLPSTLRILYGSEMGNAELVADNLEEALVAQGITAECVEMNDQPLDELGDLGLVLFVTSTCGEGDLPYTADQFWEQLSGDGAPSLVGLHYAVLTLGDSGYTYFCEAGVKLDTRLAELGASRIADRVDLDVNYVDPSDEWIDERVAQLVPLVGESGAGGEAMPQPQRVTAPRAAPSQWNRERPFQGKLIANRLLTGAGSAKEIRHYEVDIAGSGFEYQPGDSIAIVPVNAPAAVDEFLAAVGLTGDEQVNGETVRSLAERRWELRFPSAALLDALAERAPESQFARAASAADGDHAAGEEWMRTHGVCEALRQLPTPLSVMDLAVLMGPIRYRAYSIASTPTMHPDTVHLTVATQRNAERTPLRSGVGSGYLADLIEVGGALSVFPLPNRNFHLPEDPAVPVIMVGPGVGVAPFRGYLAHRAQQRDHGRSWLFYGDQHEATDFIYASEWQELLNDGTLTRLDTAFSRDQEHKVYVQDRMREQASELVSWLEDGAYLYVCGDGKRMAADVDNVLQEVVMEVRGPQRGASLLEQLHKEKRYLRDVY